MYITYIYIYDGKWKDSNMDSDGSMASMVLVALATISGEVVAIELREVGLLPRSD